LHRTLGADAEAGLRRIAVGGRASVVDLDAHLDALAEALDREPTPGDRKALSEALSSERCGGGNARS
jgi:hypothetical protein